MNNIKLREHKSSSYAPRTYHNAAQGVTLAVAVNHYTAGERLTQKAAGDKIVKVDWGTEYIQASRELYKALKKHNCHTVNVAGNGIYTFSKSGVKQEDVNQYIWNVLSKVNEHWPITKIVSGGQTGADLASLVAGVSLGIETEAMYPSGYKMRFEDEKDVLMNPQEIYRQIMDYVSALNK